VTRVVHKYPLPIEAEPFIPMPLGAQVLSVQVQRDEPMVWALVDPRQTVMMRHWFWVLNTGTPVDWDPSEDSRFIGTVQNGGFVFHVWDQGEGTRTSVPLPGPEVKP